MTRTTGTTVLVVVAGRHGSTVEIAQEIAGVLRTELPAAHVEVRDAAAPGDLADGDAVLVGSAVYLGRWLPAARHFIEGHRAQLLTVPVWLFSSGPVGIPPRPRDDLADVTTLGASIAARGHQIFSGRLDPRELRWTERVLVGAAHTASGDFRDHDAIRSWAVGIAAQLRAALDHAAAPRPDDLR